MFSSLWLIADNDVWEVCQTGEHTRLPSAVGPRSGCVHLTNEMSHGEDGGTRATKRSLQTNSPPALDCTNSPKIREELAWPANWPNRSEGSFFRGVFGCGETARSGWPGSWVICSPEKLTWGLWSLLVWWMQPVIQPSVWSLAPLWGEELRLNQRLSSSSEHLNLQWWGVRCAPPFILPLGLASLLLSSLLHCQWVRLIPPSLKLIPGALKCKPDEKTKGLGKSDGSNNNNKRTLCNLLREINEGEPPRPRWIMILDHGDERLQWIRQKVRTGRGD